MEQYGLFEIVVMLALAPVALVVAYFMFGVACAALIFIGGPLLLVVGLALLLGGGNAAGLLLLVVGAAWTAWLFTRMSQS